jgi:hypothetical protein
VSEFSFRNAPRVGTPGFTRGVEVNLAERVRRACLRAGWHRTAELGDDLAVLRRAADRRYADGRVYEGRRKGWVWEGDLPDPPAAVAVTVDGVPVAAGFAVDWENGRVIFDAPLPAAAAVRARHTFRGVQVGDSAAPWAVRLDADSLAPAADPRAGGPGGDLSVPPDRRLQYPAVAVRPLYQFAADPYEQGGTALLVTQRFELLCLADDPAELAWLHDALVREKDRPLPAFNYRTAPPPYAADGSLAPAALHFEQLCAQHPWRGLRVADARSPAHGAHGGVGWVSVILTIQGQDA